MKESELKKDKNRDFVYKIHMETLFVKATGNKMENIR